MTTPIVNNNAIILYQVPPGKPDPKQQALPDCEERGRVPQKPLKGDDCAYSVLNLLRKRIGKNHHPDLAKAREIERFYSTVRKTVHKKSSELPSFCQLLGNPAIKKNCNLNKEECREALTFWTTSVLGRIDQANIEKKNKDGRVDYISIRPAIEAFVSDPCKCKTLYDYLVYCKSNIVDLAEKLLRERHFNPDAIYQKFQQENDDLGEWNALPLEQKQGFLFSMINFAAAQEYGLKQSPWKPALGIEDLIQSLKDHGPHFIGGSLGVGMYKGAPVQISAVGNRKIYGWKKGTEKHPIGSVGHAILVVGARKEGAQEHIYFIDPEDGSDPNDIEKQKIYVMSYKSFQEGASDLRGALRDDSPFAYAIHR